MKKLFFVGMLCGASFMTEAIDKVGLWDRDELYRVPAIRKTEEYAVPGLQSFFYESVPYKGRAAWVYAYYGVPEGKPPADGWPAVVLVHGGGGTAFPQQVKSWNKYGYAAIAMDLYGCLPDQGAKWPERPRIPDAGPTFDFYWNTYQEPTTDQWFYQALAQVARANSLLRSFPEINPKKIGAIGVSWGGVIVCDLAGIDNRLAFVVPVYGCGFLPGSDGRFGATIATMDAKKRQWITENYDAAKYLPLAKMPLFFVSGTNDEHFPPDAWQKSINAAGSGAIGRLAVRMQHGHNGSEQPEIKAFADSVVHGRKTLPQVTGLTLTGNLLSAEIKTSGVVRAELAYTTDAGIHDRRKWAVIPARINENTITATIPKGATALVLNVYNANGLMTSAQYTECRN